MTRRKSEKYASVVEGIKSVYNQKIKPLEKLYKFDLFHSSALCDADIEAKPSVLLLGQYSVGKSTFVKHLLGREYPGIHIGPEPTTDRFVAVMHGTDDRVIPGNAATVQPDKPFKGLSKFGNSFLTKFQVSTMPSPLLDSISFIDTPGVLSGEKQRIGRSYDFVETCSWFADRADMILLLFDAHKLDISDEFKRVISVLRGHDEKIRVVLNKANMISTQQLMRVYGALMWSLGKVIKTPEVVRVYIGNFSDFENQTTGAAATSTSLAELHGELLTAERKDLINDLLTLPRNAATRKINEMIKRARLVKVHALIIAHLRKEMPSMFGREKKQKQLIEHLEDEFTKIQRKYNIPPGDFPDIDSFRDKLKGMDIGSFEKLNTKYMEKIEEVLSKDLPMLMELFPQAPQLSLNCSSNPFDDLGTLKANLDDPWSYSAIDHAHYGKIFDGIANGNLTVSGAQAKKLFIESFSLPLSVLAKVWELSDRDKDGALTREEFCLALHLTNVKLSGTDLPKELPDSLITPPVKSNPLEFNESYCAVEE